MIHYTSDTRCPTAAADPIPQRRCGTGSACQSLSNRLTRDSLPPRESISVRRHACPTVPLIPWRSYGFGPVSGFVGSVVVGFGFWVCPFAATETGNKNGNGKKTWRLIVAPLRCAKISRSSRAVSLPVSSSISPQRYRQYVSQAAVRLTCTTRTRCLVTETQG